MAPEPGSSLRERGAELLRQSADVRIADDTHPAYERILDDLAPDEGRILRLLATEGPQPAVDVRTARPLKIGSRLVAAGLSMIAEQAGCRRRDRTHAYLNNLNRLGLIWFSRERLEDPRRYQVLEAQPDVVGAIRQAGRGDHGPSQHPPDAIRRGLLPVVPAAGRRPGRSQVLARVG